MFCRKATHFVVTHTIADEGSLSNEAGGLGNCRQPLGLRCVNDELSLAQYHRISTVEVCVSLLCLESLENQLEFFRRRDMPLNKLNLKLPRCLPRRLRVAHRGFVTGVVERHNLADLWEYLLQNLETLPCKFVRKIVDAREPPARFRVAL